MEYPRYFARISAIACIVLPQVAIAPLLPPESKVIAGIVWGYVPPLDRPFLQRTEGSGSRGTGCRGGTNLQLLAPQDHIAATTSERPTFLWYVNNTSKPIRFVLSEPGPGAKKPILDKQINPSKPGIMGVELPLKAKLAVGKKYRWVVSIICNKKHPSENIYAYALMEKVAMTTTLKQALREKDNTQKALAYAQAGIWYDALANLYKLHVAHPKDKQATQNFFGLLDQVGLSRVVKQSAKSIGRSYDTQ